MKKGPTTLDMLIEAIKASEDRKGASVSSIKTYLVTKYQVNARGHQCPGSKMFGYNEHPFVTSSFFYIFLLVAMGTQCTSAEAWCLFQGNEAPGLIEQ